MVKLEGMRCGINIGNSLDCFTETHDATETSWGNPVITKEMIEMFADKGFGILRVPVTWDDHFGPAPDYRIDTKWMNRVKQVVDWGLESGMTVILNMHHEFRWMRCSLENLWEILPKYRILWQQIASEFEDYDERLILQGTNEPTLMGGENCSWGSGTEDVRAAINAINHTFVRTIREEKGYNKSRWLCVTGMAARPLEACMKDMIFPKDEHLIYTLHCYTPDRFVFERDRRIDTPFFDEKAKDEVYAMFEDIKKYSRLYDIPVMITEFGAVAKKLPDGSYNTEERIKFVDYFRKCADDLNIPYVWWDNNYLVEGDEHFGLFDRAKGKCLFDDLVYAITKQGV